MDDLTYTHIKPTIASAKITATPTPTTWAQAYHAGQLFAVLSLSQAEKADDDEKTLAAVGKEIINSLEEEYFTLETKSLTSIKLALQTTIKKIPSEIAPCFLVAAIITNPHAVEAKQKEILYVFAMGPGEISLKRNNDIQPLLNDTLELTAASGFLQDEDVIILQTHAFSQLIPKEKLLGTISHHGLEDAAEVLAPLIHESENGTASAIIINYKSNLLSVSEKIPAEQIDNSTQPTYAEVPSEPEKEPQKKSTSFNFNKIVALIPHINIKKISLTHVKLSPKKIIFLVIAIVIAILLIGSIFTTIQKKEHEKTVALFQSIYPQAQKKYDEGQSLVDLNTNLAHDNFLAAKKILKDGKGKFPDGSAEGKQITDLLTKTETALGSSSKTTTIEAKSVDASSSPQLQAMIKNSGTLYAAADDKNIYLLSKDAVTMLDSNNKAKVIIKNDGTWLAPAGVGAYLGNVYVLDTKANKIVKFPVTNDGYGQANYFASGVTPDLSQATGMAIDGSIFVVLKNGTIAKYTKGAADDFKISNLDKGLVNPMAIFTTVDGSNLYVLDNGHARVVVLNKSGAYQAQYQIPQAKAAKAFAVDEKNKKIYLLNGGKVWEVEMQ